MEKDPDGNDYIHDPKSAELSQTTQAIIDAARAGGCANNDEVVGWLARKLADVAVAISEIVGTEGEDLSPLGEGLIALRRKVLQNV